MSLRTYFIFAIVFIFYANLTFSQVYPPEEQLVYHQLSNTPKPAYLSPITDPVFGTTVTRITDQSTFNTYHNGLGVFHHYAKTQPWNSDGTLIKLEGWPSAILNGQTFEFIKTVNPSGGHHTWSNTQPNIIYGTNHPNYDGNCIARLDVDTNTRTLIQCFDQYEYVSHGEWEGNMSNDDRYMALQCRRPSGTMEIACYDFVTNAIISTLPAPIWPNNVTMSQSGQYVIVQWNVEGTGAVQGTWAYNSNDMSPVRNLTARGGAHFDYGYDTNGNEVIVGPVSYNRELQMRRIDNGAITTLLSESQMGYPIHVSCRNLNRPGYAYISEFAASYAVTTNPYYQKVFAVKLDPSANANAPTETFAQPHHSTNVNYNRSTFGVPNRNGSVVMFRSDWEGDANSEINSYVAFMQGAGCNLSCTGTVITQPGCGQNNGQATATAAGGTPPLSYQWNNGQTSQTANNLSAGNYTVTITDANNCTTSCTVTLTENNSGGGGTFANVNTQSSIAWNGGNAYANRPKPALGVWEPGDVSGTEIMRVSDDSGNGLHFYNSRQAWNVDMTKLMIGDGVVDENRLLDVTNNYALLPIRIPLNSQRVWSNTNPDLIYGIRGGTQFCVFNASTGVTTVLYTRPGNTVLSLRSKGNLPADDSKIALYEPSTNTVISYNIQTNSVIAEMVWPHGNINAGGNYLTYDWTGNWLVVGIGNSGLYRMNPDLSGISQIHNNVGHSDTAYDTNGESVQVITRGNGSVQVVNIDDPSQNYVSPIFGGADPAAGVLRWTPDYISGRGQQGNPGWVAFGGEAQAGSPNHPLGLYRIDGNTNTATIKVIGFDHHSSAQAASAGGNDDRQKPSVSPDGNQVIFTSDWGVANGPLSAYIIRGTGGGTPCNGNVTCSATQTVAPSCGNNNGQASVSAQNGTPPYTYSWTNGQTTPTATGLSAGSYTVTVSDANNSTSTCSVTLSGSTTLTCTITVTTTPTCGSNNGLITASVQGGTSPYAYQWNNGQTSQTANNLSAGNYTVTITDANNCTTVCSISLTAPNGLSCTVEETTAPSPGGNDGVATVTPSGGSGSTGDPRTDLLANSDRTGYGKDATGGTNYVYVNNYNELRTALQTAGNYVLLDPSLAGQGIGFTNSINPASNTTLDGSLAPGSWFYPNYAAGYPANTSMMNFFSTNNCIIHSIEMRGNRVTPYNGSHVSANVGSFNVRGSLIWFDHITITDFWGQSIMIAQGGNNISLSNMKIVNTNNGLWMNFPNSTPRHISLFNSEINAAQNTPYNEGASHFHAWNNYIHGAQYGASMAGIAQNNTPGQNGPVRTLSENNVFSNNNPYAERGFQMGESYGGPVQIPGYIYSNGCIYKNGDTTNGNVLSGNAPWTIPYNYTLIPSNQVEAYIAANAGKDNGGAATSYTYQWDDPAGQSTAIATGLSAGTYNVTITDGTGCSSVCSVTMTETRIICNLNIWLEGAYDETSGNMKNNIQQLGLLPSGQPYHFSPWGYTGNEGSGWQSGNYPPGTVDWVLITLRKTEQPDSEVGKGVGLLMQDGSIQNAAIELTAPAVSSYYIVIEHRCHLPVMSPSAIPLVNNALNYDFRTTNSYTQGGSGQKQIGNQWLMYGGNIDQSSPLGYEVTGEDIIPWQLGNGQFGNYMNEDLNLDGDVNGQDRIFLSLNNGVFSAVRK